MICVSRTNFCQLCSACVSEALDKFDHDGLLQCERQRTALSILTSGGNGAGTYTVSPQAEQDGVLPMPS